MCSQLGIVTYHAQVGGNQSNITVDTSTSSVRSVRISLVDSMRLAPRSITLASVKLDTCGLTEPLLLEQTCHLAEDGYDGLEGETALVQMEIDTRDARPKHQPVRRTPLQPDKRLQDNSSKCRNRM